MNEHTHGECPPVLTRAADLCPSCKAEWESWLGEVSEIGEIALELAFAVARSRAAGAGRRKPPRSGHECGRASAALEEARFHGCRHQIWISQRHAPSCRSGQGVVDVGRDEHIFQTYLEDQGRLAAQEVADLGLEPTLNGRRERTWIADEPDSEKQIVVYISRGTMP